MAGQGVTSPPRQSALAPFGAEAIATFDTTVVLTIGACLIFGIVALLFFVAVRSPGDRLSHTQGMRLVLVAGAALPTLILAALLVYVLPQMRPLPVPPRALGVSAVGEQFWWRTVYRAPGQPVLETANELRLPVGQTVTIELSSPDVIHSFWVPGLAGKMDMIPGRINRLIVRADKPGLYRGQCAEFCGLGHAVMAFDVIAMSPADYDRWLADERRPAVPAADPAGAATFAEYGCGGCHAIRDTQAAGRIGPDLTHLAARRHIAAGMLPMTVDAIARFTRDAPSLKPGVRMPAYPHMPPADAQAIGRYLAALK